MLLNLVKHSSFRIYFGTLTVRGLTIGSKFCFTFFLGKSYSEEVLGEYGLFSTTILLCYFVLSLSFESYGLREIIQKPLDKQLSYIRNLFVFYLVSYLIFLPLTLFVFYFDVLNSDLVLYFVILLFLETCSQTFFVLFAIIQRPVVANLVLFFSQGLWIIFILILWFIDSPLVRTLESFLFLWILGSIVANTYALYQLNKIYKPYNISNAIDWAWIKTGLSVSMIFFWATLSYKLIEFTDRYFIELKLGTAQLGVYVFYSQIANLLNTVINVMVILILYPKLIENYVKDDFSAFLIIRKKMYIRTIVIGIVLALLEVLLIQLMLDFLGKSSFENEIETFYLLLAGNIFMNLSFIPHYCLYAMRKDYVILYTTVFGAVSNVILNFLLIPLLGISGAALATSISFFSVWLLKTVYLKKYLKRIVNNTSSV